MAKSNDRRHEKGRPRSQPMPRKSKPSEATSTTPNRRSTPRHATEVTLRRRPDGNWELQHPRCAMEREEDLREVEAMIAAGEREIARDELRWLLEGCSDNIGAHELLGELALQEEDLPLARGHFGYAYQIGVKAIRRAGSPTPIPFGQALNQGFFAAAKGLVHCLVSLDKPEMAAEVAAFLLHCDPRDPLNVRSLLAG